MNPLSGRQLPWSWTDRLVPPSLAITLSLGLFWLISRAIDTSDPRDRQSTPIVAELEILQPPPEDRSENLLPERFDVPTLPAPPSPQQDLPGSGAAEAALPTMLPDTGKIRVNASINSQDLGLGLGARLFAGFGDRGGGGSGSGSGGGGGGKPYTAKEIVPLSTARPQMPEWACKQGLRGWVEVSFTVTGEGRVRDIRLVDAEPRGVFEGAAIDSVSHWIYQADGRAHEVRQRIDMLPEECAYNWK